MFSGMMLSQYTADMQIVEQRILSSPAFTQSIPAAADQEDFVSMGMNSALKTRQILDIANGVLGIEFMAAAQGLDFRSFTPGRGTRAAKTEIRRHVDFLDVDRPLHRDHNTMMELVKSLDILDGRGKRDRQARDLLIRILARPAAVPLSATKKRMREPRGIGSRIRLAASLEQARETVRAMNGPDRLEKQAYLRSTIFRVNTVRPAWNLAK